MAAGFVQVHAADVRRVDRLIAAGQQLALDEILQDRTHRRALGQPQAQPGAHVGLDAEQLQLLAQHAMVAAFGLFQLFQVLVEFLFAEPSRAVQPLQLPVAGVAFPVGAGDRQHFERLDLARVRHVRTAAQVDELALAIETQVAVVAEARRDVFDFQACFRSRHNSAALSRGNRNRSNGSASFTIRCISASIFGKSSSFSLCSRSKS